jgi:hypothetical protein
MRFYTLFAALVLLCNFPAGAQDTISTNSQSIQGTWISQVADATGNITLFPFEQVVAQRATARGLGSKNRGRTPCKAGAAIAVAPAPGQSLRSVRSRYLCRH